jgi:hypothetical protein
MGDPSDPMTAQRAAIFKPLGLELSRQMEAAFGTTPEEAESVDPPARVPEAKEVIESKIIPCERCGAVVAMLIFAPNATDPGRFEDYARKMYPQYNHLNVPTWIIGPALGEGPLIDRRRAESVADAGANPTFAACAIRSAPRSACYEALPLMRWRIVAQDSEKPMKRVRVGRSILSRRYR